MTDEVTWRRLWDEAAARLGDAVEARRIVEEACGYAGAELVTVLDAPATTRTLARFDAMVQRRSTGEPLQYVLGSWGFRTLDVHVDRRVLIPRPETEVVVQHALDVIDALGAHTVVDLGTGSGVIALSIAAERRNVDVWATDASSDALDVARANLAGLGRAGTRVRMELGDWFDALPPDLAGTVDVIVSNPPYVAIGDPLPGEVADWEPREALIAGPSGLEAIERIVVGAPDWLRTPGALVLEIGETQGDRVIELASAAFSTVDVHDDLAGRPRVVVARR
jgi:release factor glutamine methyltransferase